MNPMRNPSQRQTSETTSNFGLIHTRELIKEDIVEILEQYDPLDPSNNFENLKEMLCKRVNVRFSEIS